MYVHVQYDVISLYGQPKHIIIESVDSISRDGPDTPIYVLNTLQKAKNLGTDAVSRFLTYIARHDFQRIFYLEIPRTTQKAIKEASTR